ncbi:MAG: DUF302 domain-containing protein [Alphaproteobacteria bacterium]
MRRSILAFPAAAVLAFVLVAQAPLGTSAEAAGQSVAEDGVIKVKSAHPFAETVERLKQAVTGKGIKLFMVVEQSELAAQAGRTLRPSTLLVFGNIALGAQFLASNPFSGLDWPVRLLVVEDGNGEVWAAYTDFAYIARRHRITDRDQAFRTASNVVQSIASSVAAK